MPVYNERNCPLVLVPVRKIRPGDVYYYHGSNKKQALARQLDWWRVHNPSTGTSYDLSTRQGALNFGLTEAIKEEVADFQTYSDDCWASVWRGCPAEANPDRYAAACKAFADFDFSSKDS